MRSAPLVLFLFIFALSFSSHAEAHRRARSTAKRDAARESIRDEPPIVHKESNSSTAQLPGESEFTGCHPYPDNKRFRWDVRGEMTLGDLVASLAEISCQTIIVGPAAASRATKVSISVPDFLTAPEVYRVFYSALESMGLTVDVNGRILKVVDGSRSREVAALLTEGNNNGGVADRFVTRLLRIHHAAPAELAEIASKLKSHDGDVTVYPAGRSLIITDRASSVHKMEELVRALDVAEPGERIFSLSVHSQTATELAAAIDKVLQATRQSAPQKNGGAQNEKSGGGGLRGSDATIVPVDAARLLVVVGDEAGYARVAKLAERLDPPATDGSGSQAHVVYLANTNADEMAATLRELGFAGRGGAGRSNPGQGQGINPGGGGAAPISGDVRIAADKVSNGIIVFASPNDFGMVRDLITKLDVPRRQVYVEIAILDLSVDRSRSLGVGFHGGDQSASGTTGFVASGGKGASSLVTDAQSLASLFSSGGLTTGVFGKSFQVAGINVPSFGVVLKALEQSKDVNVISQPHLLTMDNTKASISVGQSIPFQTQSLGSTLGTTTPSLLSSYQRQDVALKLEMTPHLNDSSSIRLELDGEISDVPDGQSSSAAGGPTTNKRTIKTSVVVSDGETVVLGGLQKDSESETIEKVPGLGDIPILGRLFQYRSRQRTKQDLLIALTPYVIRGPEDLRRIFERKQAEQQEFMERFATLPEGGYAPHVDYGRKRGLLEEINVAAKAAERDAASVRQASLAKPPAPSDGPLD